MAQLSRTTGISLADSTYGAVRTMIVTCEIEPGSWVTESRLAVEAGVGKTPMREALRRLGAEGFVSAAHRRGYLVAPITISAVLEIFEAFGVIMPEVAALVAVRASAEDRRDVLAMSQRWTPGVAGAGKVAEGILSRFVALADNSTIVEMSRGVIGHMERVFNFTLLQGGMTEPAYHEAIQEALSTIVAGDADGARATFRKLSEVGRASVVTRLQQAPAVMTAQVELTPRAN